MNKECVLKAVGLVLFWSLSAINHLWFINLEYNCFETPKPETEFRQKPLLKGLQKIIIKNIFSQWPLLHICYGADEWDVLKNQQ